MTEKLIENNNGELNVFVSEINHPDEQKESNIAKQKSAEQQNEQPDTIDIPDLESEESAALEHPAKGLKIQTPNQMLNRLPISLSQLKAENNSKKLKMKSNNYCILCTDQKNLKNSKKTLIDII